VPARTAFGVPAYLAASPAAPFSTSLDMTNRKMINPHRRFASASGMEIATREER